MRLQAPSTVHNSAFSVVRGATRTTSRRSSCRALKHDRQTLSGSSRHVAGAAAGALLLLQLQQPSSLWAAELAPPLAPLAPPASALLQPPEQRRPTYLLQLLSAPTVEWSEVNRNLWFPLALSTLAGLSTAVGAVFAVSFPLTEANLAFFLGMATGVMSTVSIVELWWNLAAEQQSFVGVTAAVLVGAALFAGLDAVMPKPPEVTPDNSSNVTASNQQQQQHLQPSVSCGMGVVGAAVVQQPGEASTTDEAQEADESRQWEATLDQNTSLASSGDSSSSSGSSAAGMQWQGHSSPTAASEAVMTAQQSGLMRLGLLMAATLTLHNLPEGVSVAFSALTSIGPGVALAIALHNIPEGIVIAAPVYAATGSKAQAVGLATASGLSEPVGALVALLLLRPLITPAQLDFILAGTGGVMLAVCALELWPEGRRCRQDGHLWTGLLLVLAAGTCRIAILPVASCVCG